MSASYCSLLYLAAFLLAVILLYLILPQKQDRYYYFCRKLVFLWSISGTLIICLIFYRFCNSRHRFKLDGL